MTSSQKLGHVLCAARQDLGISQEELAERASLHRTYISQLERGLKSPTLDVIIGPAQGLAITPLQLVSRVFDGGNL